MEVGERTLHERLSAYLRDRRVLLPLDNFEHVAPAATVVSDTSPANTSIR